jgi:hypothetical protein
MTSNGRRPPDGEERGRRIPTVSTIFPGGEIVEMVHHPDRKASGFVVWDGKAWREEARLQVDTFHTLVPYSPQNNLIKNEVVLLPSAPEDYGSEEDLSAEVQAFIHRYTDLSPLFEKVASYYVLLSWVYDRFNELPYLRFRGDPGTGKTRSLLTVGSLCYKPIFASGASTVSPLFRILDAFRGTLIIDEGDFRLSDERAEVVKILNNGNARGFPVLRSEPTRKGEFNPRAYAVFGPKLVATRGFFEDRALESRFLTEEMGRSDLRRDIPISLPDEFKDEALRLRNKLLLFRFRNHHRAAVPEGLVDWSIEPRLNQIFVPLLSIVEDPAIRAELRDLARQYNGELATERGMDTEARVLEVIRDLLASPAAPPLSIKEITRVFADRHAAEYERKITTKWIGRIVRKGLGLSAEKSHGVYLIPTSETAKLPRLYERYGIEAAVGPEEGSGGAGDFGGLGDIGDVVRRG